MGLSRQEYWSGFPCPPPGDLPDLGIEPISPALQAHSSLTEPAVKPLFQKTVKMREKPGGAGLSPEWTLALHWKVAQTEVTGGISLTPAVW